MGLGLIPQEVAMNNDLKPGDQPPDDRKAGLAGQVPVRGLR